MATATPIQCSVITPERLVLDAPVTSVVFPAHDGQMGVLKDRAPIVCQMGIGAMRIDTVDQGSLTFFVDGGFAQVLDNKISILTERAVPASEISRSDAEKALAEATAMPITDDASFQARQKAIARAQARLKLATR